MGERELAEDTGLARSAYMSSESALGAELLPDEAEDTDDTLLTLSDLDREGERWSRTGEGGASAQVQLWWASKVRPAEAHINHTSWFY